MRVVKEKAGAVASAPALSIARLHSQATSQYPLSLFGSNELAARLIGERFRLSQTIARTVVELVGYGRGA